MRKVVRCPSCIRPSLTAHFSLVRPSSQLNLATPRRGAFARASNVVRLHAPEDRMTASELQTRPGYGLDELHARTRSRQPSRHCSTRCVPSSRSCARMNATSFDRSCHARVSRVDGWRAVSRNSLENRRGTRLSDGFAQPSSFAPRGPAAGTRRNRSRSSPSLGSCGTASASMRSSTASLPFQLRFQWRRQPMTWSSSHWTRSQTEQSNPTRRRMNRQRTLSIFRKSRMSRKPMSLPTTGREVAAFEDDEPRPRRTTICVLSRRKRFAGRLS